MEREERTEKKLSFFFFEHFSVFSLFFSAHDAKQNRCVSKFLSYKISIY